MKISLEKPCISDQLLSFELGRHLLARHSLDGYWTKYCVVDHPKDRDRKMPPLEAFLLNEAPTFRATQERFTIFRSQLQQRLKDGMTVASIPSGYMDDLLGLNYQNAPDVKIIGCDIDPKSCDGALENARQYGVMQPVETHCMDAWEAGKSFPQAFDMITSNGLNIYVEDPNREIELYRSFADALKPGGYLVTSFLTPPKQVDPDSPWQNIDPEALALQKKIFSNVLKVTWQNYNMPDAIKKKLEQAGFHNIEIHYDERKMFPTITAQKK